jgi:hypothetical protein
MDELLQGKVDTDHGMFTRLVSEGASPEEILWFQDNPAVPYQRDIDFYQHCFKVWFRNDSGKIVHTTNPKPPSLSSVIQEYQKRLVGQSLGIGEVNVRGTIRDRITFFKWTFEECLKSGMSNYAWWGLTDAAGWGDENLTRSVGFTAPDPVGIYALQDHPEHGRLWTRQTHGSNKEFAELYRAVCQGQISPADIPAYRFTGELRGKLEGYAQEHMSHYQWRDPHKLIQAVA